MLILASLIFPRKEVSLPSRASILLFPGLDFVLQVLDFLLVFAVGFPFILDHLLFGIVLGRVGFTLGFETVDLIFAPNGSLVVDS